MGSKKNRGLCLVQSELVQEELHDLLMVPVWVREPTDVISVTRVARNPTYLNRELNLVNNRVFL